MGPKAMVLTMPPFFLRLEDHALLIGENTVFQDPKYGEL